MKEREGERDYIGEQGRAEIIKRGSEERDRTEKKQEKKKRDAVRERRREGKGKKMRRGIKL